MSRSHDVVVAGAGPAGALAAWLAARAGRRVLIVDRDDWPRGKLCGDTLNPGVVAWLARHGLGDGPVASARRLYGMRVSGPRLTVTARYAGGRFGLALTRRDLDAWLLDQAIGAGAEFESGLTVRAPLIVTTRGRQVVGGLVVARRGRDREALRLPAAVTIGADGRASVLARALGLARVPPRPRRWAYGVYASGVAGIGDLGEMHIAAGRYVGIAPLGSELCNVCAVTGDRLHGRRPLDLVQDAIAADPRLARRFEGARFEGPVSMLGPLAVDVAIPGAPGLLLAGDAAGFVDPMTGDGLHFAFRGAELAAREALRVLASGGADAAPLRLRRARARAFGVKVGFNRLVRKLVDAPRAVDAADRAAGWAPGYVRMAVQLAGDAL